MADKVMNKTRILSKRMCRHARGFSLPEVMLALAVFAFVMVSNFALFGLSMRSIREINGRDEIIRSVPAIQTVITSMLNNKKVGTTEPATAYGWIMAGVGPGAKELYAYTYKGEPIVREGSDPILTTELKDLPNLQGGLYRVFLDISEINPEAKADMAGTWDAYDKGILVIYAKFYSVGNPNQKVDTALQHPIYSCTFTCLK